MEIGDFQKLTKEEKIKYINEQIVIKESLIVNSWQFSLAHALFYYNRSFVMNSAELSILFDDLKNYFVNV